MEMSLGLIKTIMKQHILLCCYAWKKLLHLVRIIAGAAIGKYRVIKNNETHRRARNAQK
jgi:hypothetical protein